MSRSSPDGSVVTVMVGELASATGCTPRMIRHYDRHGLLTGRRLPNGYREFDEQTVEQVRRIRILLHAGLDLDTIQPLMGCFTPGGVAAPCRILQDRVHQQLANLDRQQHQLDQARHTLQELLDS